MVKGWKTRRRSQSGGVMPRTPQLLVTDLDSPPVGEAGRAGVAGSLGWAEDEGLGEGEHDGDDPGCQHHLLGGLGRPHLVGQRVTDGQEAIHGRHHQDVGAVNWKRKPLKNVVQRILKLKTCERAGRINNCHCRFRKKKKRFFLIFFF